MVKNLPKQAALPDGVADCIRRALDEDIGSGDVTTDTIVPPDASLRGRIVAKQNGVVAGLDVAEAVWSELDERVTFTRKIDDGSTVENRTVVAEVAGPARALLTGERVALNFLGRMSGIATLTRQFVNAVATTHAIILDTRKTAPGLRFTDKLAVRLGGGQNHRTGLFDMVLIKDNHIDFAGSITAAVTRVRESGIALSVPRATATGPYATKKSRSLSLPVLTSGTRLEIEVEARTLDHVHEALALGVERILLDNMTLETMREAVEICAGRGKTEASGNVSLANVFEVARTGVDYISVGALTHSPRVFDVSLEFIDRDD